MKQIQNQISMWFGVITILIITSGAIAIAFTDFLSDRLYGNKRIFFIFTLLAYAAYRGFRIYQVIKSQKHERT